MSTTIVDAMGFELTVFHLFAAAITTSTGGSTGGEAIDRDAPRSVAIIGDGTAMKSSELDLRSLERRLVMTGEKAGDVDGKAVRSSELDLQPLERRLKRLPKNEAGRMTVFFEVTSDMFSDVFLFVMSLPTSRFLGRLALSSAFLCKQVGVGEVDA